MEQDGPGFYHAKQDTKQFKIYKLFKSEIFYLISPSHTWPWLSETTKIESRNGNEEDTTGLCTQSNIKWYVLFNHKFIDHVKYILSVTVGSTRFLVMYKKRIQSTEETT